MLSSHISAKILFRSKLFNLSMAHKMNFSTAASTGLHAIKSKSKFYSSIAKSFEKTCLIQTTAKWCKHSELVTPALLQISTEHSSKFEVVSILAFKHK